MNKDLDKKDYIEEEAFLIEHSGEIPEVAMHGSLYFLTEDPEGPALNLKPEDIFLLKQAAARRYRAIILRDLEPGNRDKRIYRGLARCAANWQRLRRFSAREGLDIREIRHEAAAALQGFLRNEAAEVQGDGRTSSINCTPEELAILIESLDISEDDLPEEWQALCPVP